MKLRHFLPALRATRFRRAVALVVALAFTLLSAGTVLADASAQSSRGSAASKVGLVFKQATDQGDSDTYGHPPQHALPCHCHAVIGGDPEPYEIAPLAMLLGSPQPSPTRFLRSRQTAPPDRPPCT